MKTIKNYLKLMRIKHYLKNGLIFLPIIFAGEIFNIDLLLSTIIGFVSFSLIASVVYILNDIQDIESDRKHAVKCKRPLASGAISKKNAILLAIILMLLATVLNIYISGLSNIYSHALLLLYLIINIFYSLGLKRKPIVDIVILVAGFLIRVLYGSVITGIEVSNWLYLTIMSASFYMGLGKRRNEILKQGDKAREVLKRYSKEFLDKNMYVFVTLCIVFYSLWTVNPNTIANIGSNALMWSVPILVVILMRYSLNVESDSHGDPIDVVLGDKILLLLVTIYVLTIFSVVYIA